MIPLENLKRTGALFFFSSSPSLLILGVWCRRLKFFSSRIANHLVHTYIHICMHIHALHYIIYLLSYSILCFLFSSCLDDKKVVVLCGSCYRRLWRMKEEWEWDAK
ncbi:hypothetical protein F5X99DRAFT_38814 [Biscogniauxia marginata]|nr:hypothetical protein F5X99DRAFT_38814 [Biscogniauxia marginata]